MSNSTKESPYTQFQNALSAVLKVSHAELKEKLEQEKKEKKPRKASSLDHASDDKD